MKTKTLTFRLNPGLDVSPRLATLGSFYLGGLKMVVTDIGHRLKVKRVEKRWTQKFLAEKLGMRERRITLIETGRAEMTIPEIVDAARVLGIDPAELAPEKFAKSTKEVL